MRLNQRPDRAVEHDRAERGETAREGGALRSGAGMAPPTRPARQRPLGRLLSVSRRKRRHVLGASQEHRASRAARIVARVIERRGIG